MIAGRLDVLVFALGGHRYGLLSSGVAEIVPAVTIVPLPDAPPIVEGIINVRGRLVPVLDIRARFRLLAKPLAHTDHLILAWAGPRLVAIRADRALELAQIDGDKVEDSDAVGGSQYLAGVAKLGDGLVLIHDLQTFLAQAEVVALDQALAADSSSLQP